MLTLSSLMARSLMMMCFMSCSLYNLLSFTCAYLFGILIVIYPDPLVIMSVI